MERTYRLVVEASPAPADVALLEERLAAAAIEAAGAGPEEEFAVFVREDDGRILAGVSGIVWGGYCELQALWVDEAHRGRGLGRRLMAAADGRPAAAVRACRQKAASSAGGTSARTSPAATASAISPAT